MADLNQDIIDYFNSIGLNRVKIATTMAECEIFRSYMMQKFGWFKSHTDEFQLGDTQHIVEITWYRYYRDNGKLPVKIDPSKIFDETLNKQEVTDIFVEIYDDYKSKGYDLLNSSSPEDYNYCIPTEL